MNFHFAYLFIHEPTALSGPGPPHYRGFTITFRHATLGSTSLDAQISANTPALTTDIRVSGGIRSHTPSKRADADPRLRPCGNWDQLILFLFEIFLMLSIFTFKGNKKFLDISYILSSITSMKRLPQPNLVVGALGLIQV